jgi:hypothetical protein
MEKLTDGVSVILTGNGEAPGGLCPPHAGNSTKTELARTTNNERQKHNLPMHPLAASLFIRRPRSSLEWRIRSLENRNRFGKRVALA